MKGIRMNEKISFILLVQNNEDTIDDVMDYIIEDMQEEDSFIVVLNNVTDKSESKIDKYLTRVKCDDIRFIIANFSEDDALKVGLENSNNKLNILVYGDKYDPIEWIKDD
jgi:glycosyltransferase involved in cell wall biosynthesis